MTCPLKHCDIVCISVTVMYACKTLSTNSCREMSDIKILVKVDASRARKLK